MASRGEPMEPRIDPTDGCWPVEAWELGSCQEASDDNPAAHTQNWVLL